LRQSVEDTCHEQEGEMMRAMLWSSALLAGLCLGGTASAQVSTNRDSNGAFVVTQAPTTTAATSGSFSQSGKQESFRMTSLLNHLSSIWSPQQGSANTTIPNPGSPEYLKAFGYQSFRRPPTLLFGLLPIH
jgi:hypothetical protein